MSAAVAVRAAGSGVQFVLNVVVGRLVSSAGTGYFIAGSMWANLVATSLAYGYPTLFTREFALSGSSGQGSGALQVFRRVVRALGLAALLATVLAVSVVTLTKAGSPLRTAGALTAVLAVVIGTLAAIVKVSGGALRGLGRTNESLAIEYSLAPALLLLALILAMLSGFAITWSSPLLLLLLVTGVSAAASVALAQGRARGVGAVTRREMCIGPASTTASKGRSVRLFWLISLANSGFSAAPYFFIPILFAPAVGGEFGVSQRVVGLAATIQSAVSAYAAPRFARGAHNGDAVALRLEWTRSRLATFGLFLPIFLVCMLWPGTVLGLFGASFRGGVGILRVLSLGRLVYATLGPTEAYLTMVGREVAEFRGSVASIAGFAAAAYPLGHSLGPVGFAVAYAGAVAVRGVLTSWAVRSHLRRQLSA